MTVDELMAMVTMYSNTREDYKRWLGESPESVAAYGAARTTLRTAQAVVADAERYAWLRKSNWYVGPDTIETDEAGGLHGYMNEHAGGNTLDTAIDTARSAGAKGGV